MSDHYYDLSKKDEIKMVSVLAVISLVLFGYLGVLVYERQYSDDEEMANTKTLESNLSKISESLNKR
ncbi:hypothetical protein [Terasakiella pusilla]|uniref:hypothetical protein n=1 Tax=Terasakiella pusilla TaxID=64973 RepID=UPI00048BC768|nr:hypothetical protein [Terasakiella pusilla]